MVSVNYIWLCAKRPEQPNQSYATQLPLHNFKRMYANAERYSGTEFNLWLDFRQLTLSDHFFLDSQRHFLNVHNIEIRNLCEIPDYKTDKGFEPDTNTTIYARADYARVLVLSFLHQLRPERTSIYSDLDCEDIMIADSRVQDTLEQYGIAYGIWNDRICNGFIGVKGPTGLQFLTDYLLPKTKMAFQRNRVNHFGAFAEAVKAFRRSTCPDQRLTSLGVVDLPRMHTEMPYDRGIYHKVCPEHSSPRPLTRNYV